MHKNFDNTWRESLDRCQRFNTLLKPYGRVDSVLSEHPFPGGISSPGLYMLDGLIFYTMYLQQVPSVYIVHPSYLKHLHGGSYGKSDSIQMAKDLKVIYMKHGYAFNKNRITHDESESFIFATRLIVLMNIDKKLTESILKYSNKFDTPKEKVLYERGIK